MTEQNTQQDGAERKSVRLPTRRSLIERVKGGSQSAWEEFYRLYWRAIYGYALKFGVSKTAVDDVVQEVFFKLARGLRGFEYDRQKGRFLSWVKTITRNTVIDHVRRHKSRVEGKSVVSMDATNCGIVDLPAAEPVDLPDPWRAEMERAILAEAFERVKASVNESCFESFMQFAWKERPASEVAQALGISENSVYVNKHRVLAKLQAAVASIREDIGFD
jgi:RNA polymerase sigma factor (sigma-70 family)